MTSEAARQVLKVMEDFSPFNRLLGTKGEHAERGRVVMVLPVRGDFVGDPHRPALHGGVISALVDTAGGGAAWTALEKGEAVSTVDLRVDFLEPKNREKRFGPQGDGSGPEKSGLYQRVWNEAP